jgi:hypothetical protein
MELARQDFQQWRLRHGDVAGAERVQDLAARVAGTAESGGLGSVAVQFAHGAEVAGAERHPDDGAEAGRPPVGVQRRPGVEDAGGAEGRLQPLVPSRRAGRVERAPLRCNCQ